MEETKEGLQQKVKALNREYIAAMKSDPEGPVKDDRLRRLQQAINEYEKRFKSF